ncbi:MAG: glycine betaine ABC transporter substrate-binding protein [Clostridia bacterium]
MKKLVARVLAGVMILSMLSGCGETETSTGSGNDNNTGSVSTETIKIATKAGTECYIMGEMLGILVEQGTGRKVEITKDIASTELIQSAMERGEFDITPEYTSTAWIFVVAREDFPTDDIMYEDLREFYQTEKNMDWTGLYGFNNTFAITVTSEIAEKYQLETYSDLSEVSSELVFGGNTNFVANDTGLPGVSETYGMEFAKVVDLAIGLNYPAMEQNEIQVTNAFTTDAQLAVADVKVLEDDKGYFSNFFCGTVARNEVLEEVEGLREALESLNGQITDAEMASMNYAVEIDGRSEKTVALEFLQSKGLAE